MYVYIEETAQFYDPTAAAKVFKVGFYIPTSGLFITESVQTTADAAAARVSYLNGGTAPS